MGTSELAGGDEGVRSGRDAGLAAGSGVRRAFYLQKNHRDARRRVGEQEPSLLRGEKAERLRRPATVRSLVIISVR